MAKQTLSIEQMQHLQELGLELKETMLLHCEKGDKVSEVFPTWMVKKEGWEFTIPAYTLQDVLDALPKDISKDGCAWYASLYIDFENNRIAYGNTDRYGFEIYHEIIIEKDLIDAAYELLCWCIEQGYVETNKNK